MAKIEKRLEEILNFNERHQLSELCRIWICENPFVPADILSVITFLYNHNLINVEKAKEFIEEKR